MKLRIATRASAQAMTQTGWVAERLRALHPGLDVELVPTDTRGDRDQTTPLAELGGKGVFAKEVQRAVLDGRADLAVHSGKDLPSMTPPGLIIAGVPIRRDARDALVGSTLAALGPGGRVATGSSRRRAQLAWLRPDLTFAGLRGNIATRLERARDHDAIVVAVAALQWLGLESHAAEILEPEVMLPQVAQGSLAIECREDDREVQKVTGALEDPLNRICFDAERSFLQTLGGDCSVPAAAYAILHADGSVHVRGIIASLDGHIMLRHHVTGSDPIAAGAQVAATLLDQGGRDLLDR